METKLCPKCNQVKSLEEYNKHKVKGTQPWCRECTKAKDKSYYERNRNDRKEKIREYTRQARERIAEFLVQVKSKGCCMCPEKEVCCMDMHHLCDKRFNIADAIRKAVSIEKLQLEVDKCIVLCSNCHRKLHAGLIQLRE